MFSTVILAVILAMSQAPPPVTVTAIPSTVEIDNIVTIVAVGDISTEAIWSLSGGDWCLMKTCTWRSTDALPYDTLENSFWRASDVGSYVITLTLPDGSSVYVSIEVTDP